MRALLVAITCIQLVLTPTFAQAASRGSRPLPVPGDRDVLEDPTMTPPAFATANELGGSSVTGSEYVAGNYPGAILVRVNLMGAVLRPGIYHVPAQTDILTFLSLAGGGIPDARIDDISIKRRGGQDGKSEAILHVNAEDLVEKANVAVPKLEANDLILVPRDHPTISQNTTNTLTFISSVFGVILAGVALSALAKK